MTQKKVSENKEASVRTIHTRDEKKFVTRYIKYEANYILFISERESKRFWTQIPYSNISYIESPVKEKKSNGAGNEDQLPNQKFIDE